jgi:SnoaL-like domain
MRTNAMICSCSERQPIISVLNRYATCLDSRDWSGLDEVFHPDATASYGVPLDGRPAIVESIRGFLGGCGPSQHLLGNYEVRVEDDHAEAVTKARVIHVGSGQRAGLAPYEAIGVYRDQLVLTSEGWRITHREFDVHISLGDIEVLQPV